MIPTDELMYILMTKSNGLFKFDGTVREMSWCATSADGVEMWTHNPDHMSAPIRSYLFSRADICALIKNKKLVKGKRSCEIHQPRW